MARPPKAPPIACLPPAYDDNVTMAIKALAAGNASEGQQKHALRWIIEQACATYDLPYRPGDDGRRDTDFALGRMFVGQQIVKQINLIKPAGSS